MVDRGGQSEEKKNIVKKKIFQVYRGLSWTTAGRPSSPFNKTFCSVWPHFGLHLFYKPTYSAAKCYFIAIANFAKSLKEHNIFM